MCKLKTSSASVSFLREGVCLHLSHFSEHFCGSILAQNTVFTIDWLWDLIVFFFNKSWTKKKDLNDHNVLRILLNCGSYYTSESDPLAKNCVSCVNDCELQRKPARFRNKWMLDVFKENAGHTISLVIYISLIIKGLWGLWLKLK